MAEFNVMEREILELLAASEERRFRQQEHTRQLMDEMDERLARYNAVADRLAQDVIRPRVEALAKHFDNASAPEEFNGGHRCVLRFERTPRFPATTSLELGVTRDGEARTVVVEYSASILPVFITLEGHDRLVMPLDGVDEERAAEWVERKLVGFVDAYLRLETTPQYQAENVAVDPVCGMSVNRAFAPASLEHDGTWYYFCLAECREKFAADPGRYLSGSLARV
jgi:YHS domain-containing protein